jgi:hypothetical protein
MSRAQFSEHGGARGSKLGFPDKETIDDRLSLKSSKKG